MKKHLFLNQKIHKKNVKQFFFIIFSIFLLAQNKSYAQQNSEFEFEKDIYEWLSEFNVPTIGVGIIENGTIIHTKVYEQFGKETSESNDILFDIASLTKTITAITTLKIIENHTLSLNEPVYKYWLPKDIKEDMRHKKLTIRFMLSHQTGFPNWRESTPSKKLKFNFEPGERYAYAGEGYKYLSKVLEKKLEKPFEEICDSILFNPLGMTDTKFYWDGSFNESQFAMGHDNQGNKLNKGKRHEANPAAGLITNIKDYTKFCLFVLNGAGLSSELYEEMMTPQTHVKNDLYFGLGWQMVQNLSNNQSVIFHFGGEAGIKTFVLLNPKEKSGIVLFTNSDNGQFVYEKVVESYFPQGVEIFEFINKKTIFENKFEVKPKNFNDYIGTYKMENGPTIETLVENNRLKFKRAGAPLYDMYAQTENRFILDEELNIEFVRDTSKKIVSIIIFLNGVELFHLNK